MKIIVPATSANLGAGFDSIGIAVNLYLTVEVLEESNDWKIDHDLGNNIPTDEKNLLLTTLSAVLKAKNSSLSAKYHLKMTSQPLPGLKLPERTGCSPDKSRFSPSLRCVSGLVTSNWSSNGSLTC